MESIERSLATPSWRKKGLTIGLANSQLYIYINHIFILTLCVGSSESSPPPFEGSTACFCFDHDEEENYAGQHDRSIEMVSYQGYGIGLEYVLLYTAFKGLRIELSAARHT